MITYFLRPLRATDMQNDMKFASPLRICSRLWLVRTSLCQPTGKSYPTIQNEAVMTLATSNNLKKNKFYHDHVSITTDAALITALSRRFDNKISLEALFCTLALVSDMIYKIGQLDDWFVLKFLGTLQQINVKYLLVAAYKIKKREKLLWFWKVTNLISPILNLNIFNTNYRSKLQNELFKEEFEQGLGRHHKAKSRIFYSPPILALNHYWKEHNFFFIFVFSTLVSMF